MKLSSYFAGPFSKRIEVLQKVVTVYTFVRIRADRMAWMRYVY